jgi:DNA topoisomerase-1
MDLGFTARMDEVLDEISEGKENPKSYLDGFFLGERGLKTLVDARKREIAYPNVLVGQHPEDAADIIVRNGKDGRPFLQHGDATTKRFADIPDDVAPADLTVDMAVELLNKKSAPAESIGFDPTTGRRLILKYRQGYYLEVERTPEEIENKVKPTWVSLPPDADPKTLSQEDLNYLCSLPKTIGKHPETNQVIEFRIGKFGPYLESGEERRTVEDWRLAQDLDVDRAVEILAMPKGRPVRKVSAPIAEFGEIEGAAGPVKVLAGRFGPYVTDGTTNATLPKGIDPAKFTAEDAKVLLDRKREAGPAAPRKPLRKTATAKKAAAPKKEAAPKAAVKKVTKPAAKKASPKKKTPKT